MEEDIARATDIEACPECDADALVRRRSWIGFPIGAVLLMVGFLAAIPTLGFSFVVSLYGVFLMVPRTRCRKCGWKKRG